MNTNIAKQSRLARMLVIMLVAAFLLTIASFTIPRPVAAWSNPVCWARWPCVGYCVAMEQLKYYICPDGCVCDTCCWFDRLEETTYYDPTCCY